MQRLAVPRLPVAVAGLWLVLAHCLHGTNKDMQLLAKYMQLVSGPLCRTAAQACIEGSSCLLLHLIHAAVAGLESLCTIMQSCADGRLHNHPGSCCCYVDGAMLAGAATLSASAAGLTHL